MPLTIEFNGREYVYEELDLDIDDAEVIQKYVGRSMGDWANGLATCEVKSVTALWWLLRKEAGQNPGSIAAKVPGFKPLRLFSAYVDAVQAEAARVAAKEAAKKAAEEAVPDPTGRPSASSPERRGTPTTPASASSAPGQSLPG